MTQPLETEDVKPGSTRNQIKTVVPFTEKDSNLILSRRITRLPFLLRHLEPTLSLV